MSAKNTSNSSEFLAKAQELLNSLQDSEEMADDGLLAQLKKNAQSTVSNYDDIMSANRNLKLGVVGRVKAGKSSFLNALLFDGRPVLPKAATPMTAALTRITYAPSVEEQQGIVHYYSREDWSLIEECSHRYEERMHRGVQVLLEGWRKTLYAKALSPSVAEQQKKEAEARQVVAEEMPEDLKVCHELVEMAQNATRHEDLPRTHMQDRYCIPSGANSAEAFIKSLSDFVGAEGQYTPMVKYIELQVHHKGLEGFEVVDTPGLNDPVASRVDVTNTFLKECDAVFVLSSVSRFLDAQDADLIKNQLYNAGVARAYIIGTMMDIGLMEYPRRKVDLLTAYKESKANYLSQSKRVLGNIGKIQPLPGRLTANSRPEFVSSIAFDISRKLQQKEELNNEEKHILDRFAKLFPGYEKMLATPDDFASFSGFAGVHKNIYAPVFEEKKQIVQERIEKFESQQSAAICTMLEDILIDAANRKSVLENNDVTTLREKLANIQENLQASRLDVHNIFAEISFNGQRVINDLKLSIRQVMSNFKRIKVESEVVTKEYSTGLIFKDYHHEVSTIHKASASNVADNIENYAVEATRLITSALGDMLNTHNIEAKLRQAIYDTFVSAGENSNKTDIVGPVRILVNTLTIPEIDFSFAVEAKKNIFATFNNEVRDTNIESLKIAQEEQLQKMYDKIVCSLDDILAKVKTTLQINGTTFVDDVCSKVNQSYKILEEQLQDKDKHVQEYKQFINRMTATKRDFAELGR